MMLRWAGKGAISGMAVADLMLADALPPARVLPFPVRYAVGRLALRVAGSRLPDGWRDAGQARGRVRIPAGMDVRLDISPGCRLRPDSLDGLDSDALQGLGLRDCPVSEADLQAISRLIGLRGVDLGGTGIDDAGAAHLSSLCRVTGLNLAGTRVGDAGLASLRRLQELEWLDLSRTKVSDEGVVHLGGMSALRFLALGDTKIGDDAAVLIAEFKQLRELRLAQTRITDTALPSLRLLENLARLDLAMTSISDHGLDELIGMKGVLRYLDLWGTCISCEGERTARRAMPDCFIAYSAAA